MIASLAILLEAESRERIHSLLLAKVSEFSFKNFKMAKNIYREKKKFKEELMVWRTKV
jgi:hypothetical protein